MQEPFPPGYIPNLKDDSPYGYQPTLWITILFVVLFSLTTAGHFVQGIYYKIWWMLPTLVLCGISEVIGWAGRLWSAKDPYRRDPFLMQICCTIFAPTFMTAGMFFIFGRLILLLGPEFSRLTPKAYAIIFISADIAALVIQAIGGAMASEADTDDGAEKGAKVMVAGIIIQMAAITIYVIVQAEYLWRLYSGRPVRAPATNASIAMATATPEEKDDAATATYGVTNARERVTRPIFMMLVGLIIATVFIYVRSIYRTIELLDGWNGPIISNEKLFNALDGMPIFMAMFTLNVFHVGRLVPSSILASSLPKGGDV